jgi:hypothetical protein
MSYGQNYGKPLRSPLNINVWIQLSNKQTGRVIWSGKDSIIATMDERRFTLEARSTRSGGHLY